MTLTTPRRMVDWVVMDVSGWIDCWLVVHANATILSTIH